MVNTAHRVTWTVVKTEVEALQLEYSWIKQYDPRFNVKYRDDKSYPYLAVSMADQIPRVQVVRGAKKPGSQYFGPYTHAWAIRETVDLLLRVFPVRSCSKGVYRRAKLSGRPCLLGYIEKCSAPCIDRITPAAHLDLAQQLCNFMSGHSNTVVKDLEQQMHTAAAELDFELAARRRDDIGALTKVLEKSTVVLPDATDADVFGLVVDELDASVYGFHVRAGRIRGERGWVVDRGAGLSDAELMHIALQQIYGEASSEGVPQEVLVSVRPPDIATVQAWLSEKRGAAVDLRVPQRGAKRELLDTVERNARQALARHKTKRTSDLTARTAALTELQSQLGLTEAPLRIECFDVSTLHGTHTVASMVVFEDGGPRTSDYRTFTITAEHAGDDLASMYEVITRRFNRYLATQTAPADPEHPDALRSDRKNSFAYPPHLVLVDGGAPQVHAAATALAQLNITDIAVAGLAKRLEEVWLPGDDYPVIFPRGSAALYLLQHLRDEAHRFAIKHHRSKRAKAMTAGVLDDVPGLGPKRAKQLLEVFGSPAAIAAAGSVELQKLPGIGPKLAAAVLAQIAGQEVTPGVNVTTGEVLDDPKT